MKEFKPATIPRFTYRGVTISYEQFCDLLVIAITLPDADATDEGPRNLKKTAERAGLVFGDDWIDRFAGDMETFLRDVITVDSAPDKDLSAYPNGSAHEMAPLLIEKYYNPDTDISRHFDPDYTIDPFEEIGAVDVNFLGREVTIGCVEGEEEKTKRLVERIEIEAGESLKALGLEIDAFRALLMGSVLIAEQLDDYSRSVPASDRIVELNHNSDPYKEMIDALDRVIVEFRNDHHLDNQLGSERRALEHALAAAQELLSDSKVRVKAVYELVVRPLKIIAERYDQVLVGALALKAIDIVVKFFGL